MELAITDQAFNSCDLAAGSLHGEEGARLNGLAVKQNSACSAQRSLATDMGACQTKNIPQVVNEQQARFHFVLMGDTIDTYADSLLHSYLTF
jgi:hypothetical protein